MEVYKPGISLSSNLLMLKWDLLNSHVHHHPIKITPGDHINVFINFEGILRNLSMQKNLSNLVSFHKQKVVLELESSILNLIGAYRTYFKKERCIPKMYFYFTDLNDRKQQMTVYNKFYRTYYRNKYVQNPQFRDMGILLNKTIIPEVKLILSYIPDCYFIESKTFDGSIIPLIVSSFSDSKNVIITTDIFDTLYLYNPNFLVIYIKRRYSNFSVMSTIQDTVESIIKNENPFDLTLFNSELYYKLLLSIKGSKIRNISSAKGFGYGKCLKLLKEGLEKDIVLRDFESIGSVLQLFPEKYQMDIKDAFQCTDLDIQYGLLSDTDIEEIKSQMVDKMDVASMEALNNKRFLEFPIQLQNLLD